MSSAAMEGLSSAIGSRTAGFPRRATLESPARGRPTSRFLMRTTSGRLEAWRSAWRIWRPVRSRTGCLPRCRSSSLPNSQTVSRGACDLDPGPSAARFAGTFLVRRASFERVGPFDESLKAGEMIEWLSRAESAGLRIETIDAVVLQRRIHDANTARRAGSSSADYLRAIKGALDRKRHAGDGAPR